MKHRLKMALREAWARLLFHTGLWAVVDRLVPRRLVILTGHCVEQQGRNDFLPADMKIPAEKLERMLRWLGRRFELCTVSGGVQSLREGRGRSLVALTMDDGYRDNRDLLLPLLERVGAPATLFLESRPLLERKLNWSHKYFWLLGRVSAEDFVFDYVAESKDEPLNILLQQAVAEGVRVSYRMKRALKYDADQRERDRSIELLFARAGGDEEALCDQLYLRAEDARALLGAGVEIGGHTVNHYVLSTLTAEEQRREVSEGKRTLEAALGTELSSFAYPFGRAWDFDERSVEAAREAGFQVAVTTHAGANLRSADPLRLARWMIDGEARLHLLAAEACGGFELLRRIGLDLSE